MKKIIFIISAAVFIFLFSASISTVSADDDPTCGGANQPCCGQSCDSSNLTCTNVGEPGFYCYANDVPITITTPQPQQPKVEVTCGTNGTGIQTAIGCLPVLGSSNEFLSSLLKWAVGVGGGIAFMLMLYAGFMIMTAQGSPERMKAGQELLTSAIAGLILLIFSVFILNFIGVDILGLGNFGFGK